ncbi:MULTISPECIES: cytochrome P450 [Tsukamurella]|uniref:Cytochrome P450 n=2 Tax=Tsukamurella TaxID=2060 RepID=A0A5C5S755_9ACTN|nr:MULTISPECIES: cytochrome P450 [Tsukamurella]NMD55738.1 cytochrome P450 [Tsukamurella columbiensis]TWS30428.1 cytochrome P450 [Tsukamurella conjunctivitidis]
MSNPVLDPYSYAFHDDPYPVFERLRAEQPVHYNPERDFWALSRYDDVRAAFRDTERLSSAWGVTLEPAAYSPDAEYAMSFLAMDDPRHLRIRRLVAKAFTPKRVAALRPWIEERVREHWAACLDRTEFDFVADFAALVPMEVISEMMGVPTADRGELRRLGDVLIHREDGVFDVPQPAAEAFFGLYQYYLDLVTERRARPADDLISALTTAQFAGDDGPETLTDAEIVGILILMIVAGNETTTKLLGNAMYWGARYPDEVAKPFGAPSAVADWSAETLRYDTSTQVLLRRAAVDVEFRGTVIPQGDRVLLLVASANRDAGVFDDAAAYRIGRDTSASLSFGFGSHFCLGSHLAKLEADVALGEVVASVRDYEVDFENVERVHSLNVRGLSSLPIRVARR